MKAEGLIWTEMLIFKNSFEKKNVEISRQLKTAKRNKTTEFVKKNGERQL